MKTIELPNVAPAVEELFHLVTNDGVIIRLPDGKAFFLAVVSDSDENDEDFADEIARTRHNSALMAMLNTRSQERPRLTAQQARTRLGLDE